MIVPSVRLLARAIILLFLATALPAYAGNRLAADLLVEQAAPAPGSSTTLAIAIRPETGWHGYWINPGDAGTPPEIEWTLPPGVTLAPLRYPVPQRLVIAGLMNHVYEHDHALLARLDVASSVKAGAKLPIRAKARWLVCSDTLCVPEEANLAIDLMAGGARGKAPPDPRFDRWRAAMPRPLGGARFEVAEDTVRLAIPYPAAQPLPNPHFFAETRDVIDYAKEQRWGRNGDWIVIEMPKAEYYAEAGQLAGVIADGPGQGFAITATRGDVPAIATPLGSLHADGNRVPLLLAVGGAILGGLLLNLMPCVFPILSLKAMSLIRAGTSAGEARREGAAYTLGAVLGTTALGIALLTLRASGEEIGWAFQLQYPATILLLYALVVLITAGLAGWITLPPLRLGGRLAQREGALGAFFTGALAAFVATPCTGPFLGAALGAALILPPASALLVFAGLGLGVGLPFLAIGFIPALRTRLPKPGGWMERVKHWLALPMGITALALLWLLWRQSGDIGLLAALAITAAGFILFWGGKRRVGLVPVAFALAASMAIGMLLPARVTSLASDVRTVTVIADAQPFDEARLTRLRQEGKPVFLYFTADWCITCKVNEAAAIERAEVVRHFRRHGIVTMVGDWTRSDPAITRFLEAQGRSGVPLYLFYPRGGGDPVILPQLLTTATLLALGQ